jgi:sugar/nucleoside kinase (ribokinase family)
MPNAAEAMAIARVDTPEAALAVLGELVETVAVKLGPAGAIACRGTEWVRAKAAEVVPVDTTGAGDSFAAGLLFGLIDGRSLAAALAIGVACGTLATRKLGGIDGQATLEDAERAVGVQPRLMEDRCG